MHTLEARYRTLEPVPSAGGRACGGNRISDGLRVIIKCARSEFPRLEELAELRYEFSVPRRLADAGAQVSRPLELVRHGHSEALVSEPAAGRELSEIIAEGAVDPVRFCRVAVALANCLESVHAAGIIHRDVKPSHFFVDEGAGTATLIDFGLASDRSERTRATNVECIEGTLAYVPPEQTGRTNRSVDQRSDLYSLGVTLYELGTGQRPFRGDDALDLIHAHLARHPPSLSQLRPQLPAVLSDIVMRLLQKVPEHRYQTASGLRADLARALSQLVETGAAERFELGQGDHSAEVRSPEELYGREQQAGELTAAFERVRGGATELVLLTGSAGVGKSALVQGVKRELVRGGHFVSGKFDQYDRGVPYSALATACGEIVRMHLTATSAELEEWKQRLSIRVDDHGLVGEPQQGSKVWAALVHLIRNAVDHGLERPDERRASGKAFPAILELGARRDGTGVLIEIADDGKGIDWSRIQQRAQQRGLASTSRADLTEALFATARSTRDELSETSGGGMGLDAVRREIRALGGSIEVESERGQGCRFKLRVPSAALGVHPLALNRSGGASRPPPAPEQRPVRDAEHDILDLDAGSRAVLLAPRELCRDAAVVHHRAVGRTAAGGDKRCSRGQESRRPSRVSRPGYSARASASSCPERAT